MKIKGTLKSLDIVMLIGQDPLLTNIVLQDIVVCLEEILFLGKVRNKM